MGYLSRGISLGGRLPKGLPSFAGETHVLFVCKQVVLRWLRWWLQPRPDAGGKEAGERSASAVPRAVCWSRCERSGFHLSVVRVAVAAVVFLFLKGARQENVVKGGLCS